MHKQVAVEELEGIIGYGDVIEGTPEGVVVMISNTFVAKVIYEEVPPVEVEGVTKVRVHNTKQEFILVSEIEKVSVVGIGYPRINLHLKSGSEAFFEVTSAEFVQGALQLLMLHIMRITQK
mgnify:FL=1